MLGMEMMFSNLIGMKPDELKAAAEKTIATIEQAGRDLREIKERLTAIEECVNKEPKANGRRKLKNGNSDCAGNTHVEL